MWTPFQKEADYYGFDVREGAQAFADLFNALDSRYGVNNGYLSAENFATSEKISRKYPMGPGMPLMEFSLNMKRFDYRMDEQYDSGAFRRSHDTSLVGIIKKVGEIADDKGWSRESSICDGLYQMLKSRDHDRVFGDTGRDR